MRNKQTYENTITSKLEALPLPDMADAIWSRIEIQLDTDMPTDDSGGSTPSPVSPTGIGLIGGSALFILAAGIISFFYFSRTDGNAETNSIELRPAQVDSVTLGYGSENPPPRNTPNLIVPITPKELPKDSTITNDSSNIISTVTIPPPVDSSQQLKDASITLTPKKDTVPPGRRSRGVKGITDDDYKIVPSKKDST